MLPVQSMRVVPRKWDIFASIVLRRDPIIAPVLTETEQRYRQSQLQEEQEKSLVCDFELKARKDEKLLEKRAQLEKEGKELSELDGEIGITSAMLVDEWTKKATNFTQRYRLDKKSEVKNEKSVWRALDRKLILVVKQDFDKKNYSSPWILPQTKNKEGESLRETAERCLASTLTGNTQATVAGNAPFAVFSHRYPKTLTTQTGAHGAKLFFFNALLVPNWNDSIVNSQQISDFKWLNSDELWSIVPGSAYKMSMRSALLE